MNRLYRAQFSPSPPPRGYVSAERAGVKWGAFRTSLLFRAGAAARPPANSQVSE